ncbi:inosine-5'-monophosphate dehydrogenase [Pseudozyma hubeiensis SY62]|uniref:Inosine-5'-monophosphate dehydrogenase n=1 Tax=Pseudozyma hubeiensis (strain SY62) TaxID=1305764 RepID=R9P7T7_PSEHS|nr:inosine-5'-monophosphate dehydrogenase [Pseudozyma hubeiensis SY62]GAC94170.1 inosine-5'-monophosphate dehydrogenase [Pseudozyma hubeiensis SY62]
MEGLEVVEGVSRSRQIQKSFVEKLVAAAPTLREWIDCLEARWDPLKVDPEILSGILPAEPIVFPRLRKLSAVWCEHLVVCECPSLEELSFNAQRVSVGTSVVRNPIVPAYRMLYHTPKLKKLHILLPSDKEARNEIFSAIYQLDQLEELYLWSRMEGFSLQTLIELQQSGGDLTTPSQIMWPALRTLGLMLSECPLYLSTGLERELCELLATRFLLHQGCRRGEARTRVAAALAAYDKTETKTLKAQKRKLAAEALAVAAESAYPGNFVTHEGVSREVFSPMLAELVTTEEHNFEQRAKPESDHMLNQLIVRHKALDVSHEFSSQRIFVEQ